MRDYRSMKHKKLGLGCSTFGGSKSKQTALRALEDAFSLGINYFDIARSYGYGQAESIVGEFIQGKRDQVVLTSKFGITPPRPFPFMHQVKDVVRFAKKWVPEFTQKIIQTYSNNQVTRPPITPRLAIETMEKSLKELKTDYLDFYLLHDCPFENAAREDVAAAMNKAKDKGMVKAWGAACENADDLNKYFNHSPSFDVLQFPYEINSQWVKKQINPPPTKVLFSVMSKSAGLKEPEENFFKSLFINQLAPGLVQNLQEAWLYIASQEFDRGVVLCSMTQRHHIERNLAIINAPDISETALLAMKNKLIGKTSTPAPIPKQWRMSKA
ncbi:MAG: aldo/keto reductase [Bacteroidota bacterium]